MKQVIGVSFFLLVFIGTACAGEFSKKQLAFPQAGEVRKYATGEREGKAICKRRKSYEFIGKIKTFVLLKFKEWLSCK